MSYVVYNLKVNSTWEISSLSLFFSNLCLTSLYIYVFYLKGLSVLRLCQIAGIYKYAIRFGKETF